MERGENTTDAAGESAPDDLGNKIRWWFVRQGIAAPNKQSRKCAPSYLPGLLLHCNHTERFFRQAVKHKTNSNADSGNYNIKNATKSVMQT